MKLNSRPTTTSSGDDGNGGCCVAPDLPEKNNCSICFQALTENNKYITVTCKHLFCIQCIYQWIKEKSTCPYCRSIIKHI